MFEQLHASAQPLSAVELSRALGTSEDATERLLCACVGLELLKSHANTDGEGKHFYTN